MSTDRTAAAAAAPAGPPEPTSTPLAAPGMSHRQILVVLGALMLGMLLAALDQTIVGTALPTIVGELGGLDHYSWVVTAYLLTSTASTPLYGKVSDLYGRKPVFQVAIVVFLLGSVLAGLSQEMWQLIGTRAIQGVGAGGLMALALAIVGDIIPPRERGRYQGYFGVVFAVSSVAGPLLGGYFTDGPGWRWVFYLNVPLGILALVVTSAVLKAPFERRHHTIDYTGAALLVAAVTSLLLVTVWGGTEHAWTSPTIVGLGVAGTVLLVVFVRWESRTAEPILPPRLFADPVVSVGNAIGLILGMAMFGAILYLPIYLQVVEGVSATESGLRLLPLMVGLLAASITSGRLISSRGRYRVFPIAGTAVMGVGLLMLSRLDGATSSWLSSLAMLVVGVGIGLVMQTLVLAIQNSVDPREMGVATSSATFFRSMGGAFGTAVFGAILNSRLTSELAQRLPQGGGAGVPEGDALLGSPEAIRGLPDPVRAAVVDSFVEALQVVFTTAVPLAVLAFALAWFLPERRLRSGGDAPSAPVEA